MWCVVMRGVESTRSVILTNSVLPSGVRCLRCNTLSDLLFFSSCVCSSIVKGGLMYMVRANLCKVTLAAHPASPMCSSNESLLQVRFKTTHLKEGADAPAGTVAAVWSVML